MSNVISIQSARIARASKQAAKANCSLEVDFSDVVRRSRESNEGAFVESLQDPVELGARAAQQVRTVFWRHGLQRTPQTWGELVGNLNYCRLLSMWLLRFPPVEFKGMRDAVFAEHEARSPGRGVVLAHLADAKPVDAWHAHQEMGTFEANARDIRLTRHAPAPANSRA